MVFSSAPFIFIFLPVVFTLYAVMPGLRGKNALLTIASLLFYAYGEPVFALVMIGSVVMNYVFARVIAGLSGKKISKEDAAEQVPDDSSENAPAENSVSTYPGCSHPESAQAEAGVSTDPAYAHGVARAFVLAISVIANLALIGVFKYAGFFVESLNGALHTGLPVPEIALPIGISFFTFQAMSYVIDVYRRPETVQKNLGKVMLYISFFPQLIAGPIVKYHDIAKYLDERHADMDEIAGGVQRFVTGLAKKLFLANTMGQVADMMFGLPEGNMSAVTAWIGAVCYTFQIFFDFSGYSDMAIGIGHMFGFTIKENFDHPYISSSIKEFWRRWHISLSTWFREYLYIPLGGSRHGILRTELNKLIVFFCTGLWHGASWNFVIWGMIHGAAITLEDALGIGPGLHLKTLEDGRTEFDPDKRPGVIMGFIGWVYTMLIVILAFVLFRADDLPQGMLMLSEMFTGGLGSIASFNTVMEVLNMYNIFIFLCCVFVSMPHAVLTKWLREKGPVSYLLTLILFGLCVLEIAGASFNPFIYFRF